MYSAFFQNIMVYGIGKFTESIDPTKWHVDIVESCMYIIGACQAEKERKRLRQETDE